jgi:glucose 1-dehydrogenase
MGEAGHSPQGSHPLCCSPLAARWYEADLQSWEAERTGRRDQQVGTVPGGRTNHPTGGSEARQTGNYHRQGRGQPATTSASPSDLRFATLILSTNFTAPQVTYQIWLRIRIALAGDPYLGGPIANGVPVCEDGRVRERKVRKYGRWEGLTESLKSLRRARVPTPPPDAMLAIAARRNTTQPALIEVARPPEPRRGELLCQTIELGVCGTDREILHSAAPWTPPGADHLILGHECLARIVAVGQDVNEFRPGDLVVPVVRRALPGAGRRVDLLPFGAFTERGIVCEHGFSQPLWIDRLEHLFPVPEEIAPWAVLTEPLAVAEKGINEALLLQQARLDEPWSPRVLVTGMGPIGFTAVLAAIARGWPVTMVGRDEPGTFRARLVRQLGGEYQPLDLTAGYDLLLECTGSDTVMAHAARQVRSCGVVVWLGSSRTPQPTLANWQRLMREGLLRNHLHLGCVNAAPRDFRDALCHLGALAKDFPRELSALITARVALAEALWHYEHRAPQGIKTVVTYTAL